MYGSDQSASIEIRGMNELVSSIKKMVIAYGQPKLGEILEEEKKISKKLRKHLKI